MKRTARTAMTKIRNMGAFVYEDNDYGAHFIVGAEDGGVVGDYWREYIREYVDDSGKIHNAFGIRTAVNDLLNERDLYAEWINAGMFGVYDI